MSPAHGARLDQRRALPVAPDALVVVERRRGRDRDLGRGRIGPQPQIGAEHVAVGGALLQELHQRAREPHVERRRLGPRRQRGRRGVVEHDEVDVARIVELVRAHLAHGEHDVAAARFGPRRIGRMERPAPRGGGEEVAHRRADRRIGELGERAGDAHHRPRPPISASAIKSAPSAFMRRKSAIASASSCVAAVARPAVASKSVEQAIGVGSEQIHQPVRLGAHKIPEIGRAFGEARDQCVHHRMVREQPLEDIARWRVRNLGEPGGDAQCAAATSCGAATIRCKSARSRDSTTGCSISSIIPSRPALGQA